jgi:hypothetical protein
VTQAPLVINSIHVCFFLLRSFGIIGLGGNSRQIYGFKGVIRKIFRNKELATLNSFEGRRRGAWVLRFAKESKMKKGCGSGPHPF